jgi:hypothetical protein
METQKITLSITKEKLFKTIKNSNEKELKTQLNEIIFNNRKDKSTYKGMTKRKIINTRHVKKEELILFLQENDLLDQLETFL